MLRVEGLEKRYGALQALAGVSLQVSPGQIVGLLGPNGAGKTTTVSIIAGLLAADGGSVRFDGSPLRGDTDPAKRSLGLVPQELALYEELSAIDNLRFFGSLYGLSGRELARVAGEALELVRLSDRSRTKVKTFSGGMRRRLNLAAALLHDPKLLILDEPTVGVDPQSRNAIFENLETLRARGKSILYTTHYMEEAERLCERIVIIDHGRVLADASLRELQRRLPAPNRLEVEVEGPLGEDLLRALCDLGGVDQATLHDGTLEVSLDDLAATGPEVLRWLRERGVSFNQFRTQRVGLEEVFLALTGKELRDA